MEDFNQYSYNSFLCSTLITSSSISHNLSLDIRTYSISLTVVDHDDIGNLLWSYISDPALQRYAS